jgi:hypothetical protein
MGHYKFICNHCGKECLREIRQKTPCRPKKHEYCSIECHNKAQVTAITLPCGNCGKSVTRVKCEVSASKSGHIFCNRSCSISFHNKNRRRSRRSKCEELLFNLLKQEFPQLELSANDKSLLDGLEVDIAIPSLRIAIEWNGPVHYYPIWGQEKLDKIKVIDAQKKMIAEKNEIQLIIVPDLVSTPKYVRETFFEISKTIRSLTARAGLEPA